MAKIVACLVAVFLAVSCASGTTLQEVCKSTSDAKYCEKLVKRTVNKSTDFKSEEWKKMVIDRALVKITIALDNAIEKSDPEGPTYKTCIDFLSQAINLIANDNLNDAQSYVNNCASSLDDTSEETIDVKKLADEAVKATQVVGDILGKV